LLLLLLVAVSLGPRRHAGRLRRTAASARGRTCGNLAAAIGAHHNSAFHMAGAALRAACFAEAAPVRGDWRRASALVEPSSAAPPAPVVAPAAAKPATSGRNRQARDKPWQAGYTAPRQSSSVAGHLSIAIPLGSARVFTLVSQRPARVARLRNGLFCLLSPPPSPVSLRPLQSQPIPRSIW